MTTLIESLSATAAMVGSLGQHGAASQPAAIAVALDEALYALRAAQLALYCDHDGDAMIALRKARRSLMDDPAGEAEALATLDEAAWHIRRHDSREAQIAIARVYKRLV